MTIKKMPGAQSKPGNQSKSEHRTKIETILEALHDEHGLNRFEAEQLGDHCLNTTVAVLRARGHSIRSCWERVPTRHNPKGVRVLRYQAIAEGAA